MVEKEFVGGSCINYGCTPTNTIIASAKVAYTIANANSLAIITGSHKVAMPVVIARKTKVVETFRNASREGLESTQNLALIFGTATFIDKKRVQLKHEDGSTRIIEADKIFVDVGGRPSVPDIEGLENGRYLNSSTILDLT